MAKTITIDNVSLTRLQFIRNGAGQVQVYAEYALRAGTDIVRTIHKEVTPQLSAARVSAATAAMDAIGQDISAAELA